MGTGMVPETSAIFSQLTWLVTPENFINDFRISEIISVENYPLNGPQNINKMDETGFSATYKPEKVMAEKGLTLFTMSRQERKMSM
jgi:hypothetical protein